MFFLIVSLTYLTLIRVVSSDCAYFNSYYALYPLQLCLQASGFDFNSHWHRCQSGYIVWEKFESSDCSGSAKYSQAYDNNGYKCSGSGYDCNYLILRHSGSGNSCPNSQTTPYIDYAYIINTCFDSDMYSTKVAFICQSGALNFKTFSTNDCQGSETNNIQINNKCNSYNEWLSLPYSCGNYANPQNSDGNNGDITTETPTTTTTTTTEPPLECKGAMVTGLSHYLPWITSYTIESDAISYTYQSIGNYYLIYPCQVIGNYALPFELYVTLKTCWYRPQSDYSCLDSVVLKLLPRSTNPIIIEMNGLKNEWGTTLLTINGKYVYNDLPLLNQRFSGDSVSGSYDIEIIETEFINGEKNQITVYIDGSDCDPALRFSIQSMWLYVDCPTCYTDNICGVLGHWDELNGNITFPIKNQDVSDGIDTENYSDLKLFFESWKKTVYNIDAIGSERRLQWSTTSDYPDLCDNSQYRDMYYDIRRQCREQLYDINENCCDEISGVCTHLYDICTYDICACIESLNNTNNTYSYYNKPPVNASEIIDVCMNNVTEFIKSVNATCDELRWTVDINEYYGEYNKFTYNLLPLFFGLVLIVPIVVGIYCFRKRSLINNIDNNIDNSPGNKHDLNDVDDNKNDVEHNNNYMVIQQFDNDDNNGNTYEGEIR